MVIKEFDIVLDLKRTKQLNVIEVVQGDFETNIFNIQIEDNYIPVNLTGTTIDVMFAKPDNTSVMQDNAEIIDPAGGKIKLVLNTNTIAAYGKVFAEVRIKESGKIVTTAQFSFWVRRAIVSNVVSSNEYPVLEKIIKDATEAQDKYEEMVKRSFVILKPPVATAADIPTTYPNPENGWTTRAQDTGNMYRYNRYTDSWELIDNIPSTAYDALLNEFRPAIENLQTDFSAHLLENVTQKEVHGLKIEEGNWTPFLGASTADGTHTYSFQTGRYFKIGKMVKVSFRLELSAKDTAMSGYIFIKGLPFITGSSDGERNGLILNRVANITLPTGATSLSGGPGIGANTIGLLGYGTDLGVTLIMADAIKDNTIIWGSAIYTTN